VVPSTIHFHDDDDDDGDAKGYHSATVDDQTPLDLMTDTRHHQRTRIPAAVTAGLRNCSSNASGSTPACCRDQQEPSAE